MVDFGFKLKRFNSKVLLLLKENNKISTLNLKKNYKIENCVKLKILLTFTQLIPFQKIGNKKLKNK